MNDLIAILQERYRRLLQPRLNYIDEDGDVLTISSDIELHEALAAGCVYLEAFPSKTVDQEFEDWDLVEFVSHKGNGGYCNEGEAPSVARIAWTSELRFWLNGEEQVIQNPAPGVMFLDWLREVKGLTGTHKGCGEGGCGICTVALVKMNPVKQNLEIVPINSCLRMLCAVDGCHVITTEGLGSKKAIHAVQSAIADGNGSQCGYCTPGWVMSMYSLLQKTPSPSREQLERHFDGNLCRCTGYRPILSAFGAFAKGGSCCGKYEVVGHPAAMITYQPKPLHFTDASTGEEYYRPLTLDQYAAVAANAKKTQKRLYPLAAGIAADVENNTIFCDVTLLPELLDVSEDSDALSYGAALSIEAVIDSLEGHANDPCGGLFFKKCAMHLKRIASVQIRSVGTWAGNVMMAKGWPAFPSDMVLVLSAVGAYVRVLNTDTNTVKEVTVPDLMNLEGNLLIVSMKIPRPPAGVVFETFKTAHRNAYAIAIVNFGAFLTFEEDQATAKDISIVIGGVGDRLLVASETAAIIKGKRLDAVCFKATLAALFAELNANVSSEPFQSASYHQQLAESFLYKFFLAAQSQLLPKYRSALTPFIPYWARPVSSGSEEYGISTSENAVSRWKTKADARIQATGEAKYPSDFGIGALFGQIVLSTSANAKLQGLDPSSALKLPGVVDFITASAIPGMNCPNAPLGGENLKEKIFFEVGDTIPCVGAMLGLIVADTWDHAYKAAHQVTQTYASADPIVCIDDAIRLQKTGHPDPSSAKAAAAMSKRRGINPEHAAGVEHTQRVLHEDESEGVTTIEGTFKTGGQRHFYMETQSVFAHQHEGGNWEVIISDQDSNFVQAALALVLGIPANYINVIVPRCGGAFGGKLTRQLLVGCAAVVAANKLNKPIRIQNERSDDTAMVVGREPMIFDYNVAFDANTGKVDSLKMTITMDPGYFYGDAVGDMNMAVGWSDNCYSYRDFKVTPKFALTNTPHSTSMRAPGCMQSILASEVVLERIAKAVNKPLEEVQALNFYQLEQHPVTPFGDHLGKDGYNWTIPQLWSQLQEKAKFADRKQAIDEYNEANRWTKKGIAISPVKYVMGTNVYSSGALVCIYSDGSVLVSTGGTECGQGLNEKVRLCAADALGVPVERIQVGPRETSKIPNNSGTGGSGTSESTAQAVIQAFTELKGRLKQYQDKGQTYEQAISNANKDGVSLLATSWWKQPLTGNTNAYATYGVGISEVMIDVLTGEVRTERVDILMDLGTQLDAAIDIGQLQGGFVIAIGYLLTEELKVDSTGTQLNLSMWNYKIPSAFDIPVEFNVSLLKDSPNPIGIKGSKASAEPVMCLVSCLYLAVKNAIYAARLELGQGVDWFSLDVPLVPEKVRAAIGDITDQMIFH